METIKTAETFQTFDAGAALAGDQPELSRSRRSIELDVGGSDFLLRGKFADWESGLAFGPDLDRVSVRLAIDATSGVRGGSDLFTFYSRDVKAVGHGAYRAVGTFTGARGYRPSRCSSRTRLDTPPCGADFQREKAGLRRGMARPDPERRAVRGRADGGPVRSAQAWLVAPNLAAA